MHHLTRRLAAIAAASVLALGGTALTAPTADAAPKPLYPSSARAKAHPVKVAKAEARYYTHLGPSKAWRKAGPKERANAKRAYLWEFGSWEEGCLADLKHAYQGRTGKHGLDDVAPWLPVSRLKVPGRDIYLAEYTDGICND